MPRRLTREGKKSHQRQKEEAVSNNLTYNLLESILHSASTTTHHKAVSPTRGFKESPHTPSYYASKKTLGTDFNTKVTGEVRIATIPEYCTRLPTQSKSRDQFQRGCRSKKSRSKASRFFEEQIAHNQSPIILYSKAPGADVPSRKRERKSFPSSIDTLAEVRIIV